MAASPHHRLPVPLLPLALCALAAPQDPGLELFREVVGPALQGRCVECHNPDKARAGFDLTTREALLSGSENGAMIEPGAPEDSVLLWLVDHEEKPFMPHKKEQLSAEVRRALHRWVELGAPYDGPLTHSGEKEISDADRDHWAFRPLPPVDGLSIDELLRPRLEELGLQPAPAAPPHALLRRASLDLIGLPPTPEQTRRFLSAWALDPTQAWDQLIEDLLANPQHGERWGRHWLDAARYADSGGYEFDVERPAAWPYRDWVIDAINQDLPYDEFLRLQLAGDELHPDSAAAHAATGFLTSGPAVSNQQTEQNRYDELDDMLATTGSAMLGLTLACARCHDHKFDPLPQRDYYALLAALIGTERRERPMLDGAALAAWERQRDLHRARLQEAEAALEANPAEVESIRQQAPPTPPMVLAIRDRGPEPPPSWLLGRGDPNDKREELEFGFLRVLTPEKVAKEHFPVHPSVHSSGRRSALAAWLTDVEHGAGRLVARVEANRIWHHHFGRGLVPTPGDLGTRADPPTHPTLLDQLAARLVASGWSRKALHREILHSAAWRRGGPRNPTLERVDADNLAWSYRPPLRLEAEAIRDSMLAVSGCLNPARGGPGVHPWIPDAVIATGSTAKWPRGVVDGPATWRRSVYVFVRRSVLMPTLQTFDLPDGAQSCTRRDRTTTPIQALALLNNPFVRDQAEHFAARVVREVGGDPAAQIEAVFRIALSRTPDEVERRAVASFLAEHGLADLCHVMFNLNEFLHQP